MLFLTTSDIIGELLTEGKVIVVQRPSQGDMAKLSTYLPIRTINQELVKKIKWVLRKV